MCIRDSLPSFLVVVCLSSSENPIYYLNRNLRHWLGNCVGLRNYNTFFFFVLCLTISLLFVIALTTTHLTMILVDFGRTHSFGGAIGLALSRPPPEYPFN